MHALQQSFSAILRRPLFSGGIILTLGLALAATLLVLGLLDSYLLRPLPYGQPGRLVSIHEYQLTAGPGNPWRMTFGNAADIHDHVRAFSRTAIVRNESFTAQTPGGMEVAFIQRVTPEFFPMLGLAAQLGEVIHPANAEVAGERALVLSHEFWHRRFGADPGVLGTSVALDGRGYRIVGVLPPATVLPLVGDQQQGWVAMLPVDFARDERAVRRHFMFGELAPGASIATARGELATLARTLGRDHPATNADKGLTAVDLRDALLGNFRQQLLILQATVALVLVVACVNAGCLLLVQAIRRRREFAVRLALGAGSFRLFRQFFLESFVLTSLGAGLGLLLALWLAPLTLNLLPPTAGLRQLPGPEIGLPVVAAALFLAMAIAAGFSLVPLWQAARLNLEATLRNGARQIGSATGNFSIRLLVCIQVALALALLISAVQLMRSFHAIRSVDHGIPVAQLHSFRLGTRGDAYADPAARVRYFEAVIARLQELPHVAAGAATDFAFATVPASYFGFVQEGDGLQLTETPKRAARRYVSAGLLEALQLRLHAGRWLGDHDRADTARVVVISRSLAEKYWPGQDPIGRRVRIEGAPAGWWEVVGVVSDILSHGNQPAVIDSFFLPHTQATPADTGILIRVQGSQPLSPEQVAQAVSAVDPEATAYLHARAADFFANSAWQTRFSLTLVGIFASLAVTLCLMGVYAVLAFAVAGRTAEFGLRLALGASPVTVARLVLRDGLRMTLPGLLAGIVLAWLVTRTVAHLLYNVATVDPAAYLLTFAALAAACTLACLIPARRATKIDPMVALRAE
jgi:putative ABC transport system permease protein